MSSWARIARRIRVPLGFVFAILYGWLARPSGMSMFLGALLIIPGLVIRAVASGHLRKNEELATTGPYAYTRNPLYLGSLVLAVGFAVASRSWWIGGITVLMFVAIYLPVIGGEEKFLRDKFSDFRAYSQRVPRIIPRLTAGGNPGGSFSRELYWKHREYNALLGAAAVMALLAGKLLWISR